MKWQEMSFESLLAELERAFGILNDAYDFEEKTQAARYYMNLREFIINNCDWKKL